MRYFFNDVPEELWRDYRWQIQNRIKDAETIGKYLELLPEEIEGFRKTRGKYPFAITPYYLSLINPEDPNDPIRIQALPRSVEMDQQVQRDGDPNPFKEETLIPGLTHRYPDRVLMSLTTFCPVYCRHCMRKRIFEEGERSRTQNEILQMVTYIKQTPSVREVILSGGEPLSLSTKKLEFILREIRKIKHVEIIRIGTRMPVLVPQRFLDRELLEILERYQPIWISTHFNHPNEITNLSREAIDNILRSGTPVLNQTVLLKGVNDEPETILSLMRMLTTIKVKPQYLFHCDPVKGAMHFRTTLEKGLEIITYLRGKIGGYGIPTYAVDLPGGKGKVPILPEYFRKISKDTYSFLSFAGEEVLYSIYEHSSQTPAGSPQEHQGPF